MWKLLSEDALGYDCDIYAALKHSSDKLRESK
jgi:hypothetical protein